MAVCLSWHDKVRLRSCWPTRDLFATAFGTLAGHAKASPRYPVMTAIEAVRDVRLGWLRWATHAYSFQGDRYFSCIVCHKTLPSAPGA